MKNRRNILFVLSVFAALPCAAADVAFLEKQLLGVEKAFAARRAVPSRARSVDEKKELLRQLEDSDPLIREAAAKSLKGYVSDNDVRYTLVEKALSSSETPAVRVQAVKSLSFALQQKAGRYRSGAVRDVLLDLAESSSHPDAVRVISLKALYAANDDKTWQAVADILESSSYSPSVRKAAAWGLFGNTDTRVRRRLVHVAENRNFELGLRIEAVKSLFNWMQNSDVYKPVLELAENTNEGEALRVTAILTLQAANHNNEVGRFLKDTANNTSNSPSIRRAAVQASSRSWGMETVRFFHLSFFRGVFVDPLENE